MESTDTTLAPTPSPTPWYGPVWGLTAPILVFLLSCWLWQADSVLRPLLCFVGMHAIGLCSARLLRHMAPSVDVPTLGFLALAWGLWWWMITLFVALWGPQ